MDILSMVYDFGPSLGVILFFLGRDAAREERMEGRITELTHFIQNELIELIKNYATDE